MHQQPIAIYSTCERCNCRVKVTRNREAHICYCKDCLELMRLEKKRLRSKWAGTGTYLLIFDPDESWSPCGGWFSEEEIIRDIVCFTPGTRFDSRGVLYTITAEFRLERVVQN